MPLSETISITLDHTFVSISTFFKFISPVFTKLLDLCIISSFFLFDAALYMQDEGFGMGLPLWPIFTNVFLCGYLKQNGYQSAPPKFQACVL